MLRTCSKFVRSEQNVVRKRQNLLRSSQKKVSMKSGRLRLPDAPPPADTNHMNQDPHVSLSFKMYHMVILFQKV